MSITMATLRKLDDMGGEFRTASIELIQRAFDLVCDKKDWKAPVNATLQIETLYFDPAVIVYAIAYMTATDAVTIEKNGEITFKAPDTGMARPTKYPVTKTQHESHIAMKTKRVVPSRLICTVGPDRPTPTHLVSAGAKERALNRVEHLKKILKAMED